MGTERGRVSKGTHQEEGVQEEKWSRKRELRKKKGVGRGGSGRKRA